MSKTVSVCVSDAFHKGVFDELTIISVAHLLSNCFVDFVFIHIDINVDVDHR